jgi:translation initiation factor 1
VSSGDEKSDGGGPFNNPFAALKGKLGELPAGPTAPVAKAPKGPARAVVRLERKGRGGKEVTVVEQLELSLVQREHWLKALKGALGCGGVLEGDALVLQGDHRERLPKLLEQRGVRKVISG